MRKRITTFVIIAITLLIYPQSHAHGNSHDTCSTQSNRAPVVVDSIPPVTLGADPVTISLSDKFSDPDSSDTLRFRATISDTTIVMAYVDSSNVDSSKVIIKPKEGSRDSTAVIRTTLTVMRYIQKLWMSKSKERIL